MEKKWSFKVWAKANTKKIVFTVGGLLALVGIGFLVVNNSDNGKSDKADAVQEQNETISMDTGSSANIAE